MDDLELCSWDGQADADHAAFQQEAVGLPLLFSRVHLGCRVRGGVDGAENGLLANCARCVAARGVEQGLKPVGQDRPALVLQVAGLAGASVAVGGDVLKELVGVGNVGRGHNAAAWVLGAGRDEKGVGFARVIEGRLGPGTGDSGQKQGSANCRPRKVHKFAALRVHALLLWSIARKPLELQAFRGALCHPAHGGSQFATPTNLAWRSKG